jgi:hypothetical protein
MVGDELVRSINKSSLEAEAVNITTQHSSLDAPITSLNHSNMTNQSQQFGFSQGEWNRTETMALFVWHITLLAARLLSKILLPVLFHFHSTYAYGPLLINNVIIAFLADILRRINEQHNLMACWNEKQQDRKALMKKIGNEGLLPSTLAMIQVRDVLVALRETFGLYRVVVYFHDMCVMLCYMGLFVALISSKHVWLAGLMTYPMPFALAKSLLIPLTFGILQDELDEIHDTNQLILAKQTYDTKTRLQAGTNLRLAKEMAQISPTDMVDPNISSYLETYLKIFALAAAIQKAREVAVNN